MIDAVDSYFSYVQNRVQTLINPSRIFSGVCDAQDWPAKTQVFNSFYLLTHGETPVRGAVSTFSPLYRYQLTWIWLVLGSDLQSTEQGENRGDKYRIAYQMQNELRQGNYPSFCPMLTYTVVGQGTGNPQQVGTQTLDPFGQAMTVRWGIPNFRRKVDKASGLSFGSAEVDVFAFAPGIPLSET